MLDPHVAAARFGLGARPGEAEALGENPAAALLAQLAAGAALVTDVPLPATETAFVDFRVFRKRRHDMKRGIPVAPVANEVNPNLDVPRRELAARVENARRTDRPFAERMAMFFANHFTVSGDRTNVRALTGAFERDAIRPHVSGRFRAMLGAVVRHPAMLIYLSNTTSVGPNSRAGKRRGRGLNENLARELMELHTLGVDGGYTQADVRALACALTGWNVTDFGRRAGKFEFQEKQHEPGPKTVLGRTYPEAGVDEVEAILDDLAAHPATARHLSRRLAVHFVADEPPAELVAALAARFADSGGDLLATAEALLEHPASAQPEARKVLTPTRFVLAAARAFDAPLSGGATYRDLSELGQRPWEPGSPKGWEDLNRAWLASKALHVRLDWAHGLAARHAPAAAPDAFARVLFGSRLTDETRFALRAAESPVQAYTLLLMSPEFQKS